MQDLNGIIVECQKGNRSAQKALYNMFAPKMLGVCLRYAGNRESAEDFLQDGFIKVFEKIHTFRFKGSFEGWMRRIMVNLIIESFRRQKFTTGEIDEYADEGALIGEEESSDEITPPSLDVLLALVQQLPERYRLVFNLYVLEELSHDEIARQLNISSGTSKSNLSRARKLLQQKIREYYRNESVKI